jgi:capsular polysaccharide biosynthesis protein
MHDTHVELVREAVNSQDLDETIRLIQDGGIEFWRRRLGLEAVFDGAGDVFAIATFNRLFLPLNEGTDEETYLLMEWWLHRETQTASPQRLFYLRRFLHEAACFRHFPERFHTAAIAVFAAWTHGKNTLASWSEITRVTKGLLATYGESAPRRLTNPHILRAALWSGDIGLMRAIADIGCHAAETEDERLMVHFIVSNLVAFSDNTTLLPLAEAMHAKDPALPVAIHNLAQVYAANYRPIPEIAALYWPIEERSMPDLFKVTLDWIGQTCFDKGYKDLAVRLFAMLPEMPAVELRNMSLPQRVLQEQTTALPATVPAIASLLDVHGLPPVLEQPLEQAARLAHGDMTWNAALTPQALAAEFAEVVRKIRCIPAGFDLPGDCVRAVQRLVALARKYFEPYRHYVGVTPIPLTEKYGKMDVERLRAGYHGLYATAAAVAQIGLEALLAGAPLHPVETCLHLLGYFTSAHVACDTADAALPLLMRFKALESCTDFANRQLERCFLTQGSVAEVEALLSPAEQLRNAVYEVVDRQRWSTAEELAWQPLFEGAPCKSAFEVADMEGTIRAYGHTVPAVSLAAARPGLITVRHGEVIRGRKDLILRPKKFHYPELFPADTPDILACGERAVRLQRLGATRDVTEPVLVLENFDARRHRNYYHWVVLLLARINHVKMRGLLDGRRLLIPDGLNPWMLASCKAIGLTDSDMMVAPPDAELRLTDALLISSVEFASPRLIQDLCATVLPPSDKDGAAEPPLHIFLSRRGHTRRAFLNEDEIESVAAALGFTIMQPETLTFIEQAHLFRRAASVAGPEGAAFANMIFCRPGTKVLAILNENDLFPTYNDIAAILDLKHRKLTGKAELDFYGANFLWAPYRVNAALAERSLRWSLRG